jgi:prolyl oligopeptidase
MTTPRFAYPPARRDDVSDDYHGTPVADPYRWMENPDDIELRAWIDAQNQITADFLAGVPSRESIHRRLTQQWNFTRYSVPQRKGEYYFYTRIDPGQNQPVFYGQNGLEGEPFVVIDPNALSDDGTQAISSWQFSGDGRLMAYGLSSGGSDWQEIHVRDTQTGQDYDDVLRWCKFAGVAWKKDGSGFFYNRYPEPANVLDTTQVTRNNQVWWHTVGTPQSADRLVYERPDAPDLNFRPLMTDDGQYLVLHVWHGSVNRNRIYYRAAESDGDFIRLLDEADASYNLIGSDGPLFTFQTDLDAPNGRIIAIDTTNPARDQWRAIVPESDDAIFTALVVNHQLAVVYMRHASHQIRLFGLDGSPLGDVPLPGFGALQEISGEPDQAEMFINFQSFTQPPVIYRYDFTTGQLEPWRASQTDFAGDQFETRQVFFESKDGTRVPMFIIHRKGLALTGDHPTLLYGYGGFNAPMLPGFTIHALQWLERGGVFATVNLRGGSEYGEAWHQAGMLDRKQNVFDDFIAAAEWLIAHQYTRTAKLAIMGRSNGGLLVGAVMTQRPELFGAVICVVPVTDMLRYHKFTAGRYWTYEYGNAEENPEHFRFLYAYSPLHNTRPGAVYPATLITTADHDDRVVPMHAEKFAAALQHADAGHNPILLRLDTKSGHALGKPVWKWIDEWADIYAFLDRVLKVEAAR